MKKIALVLAALAVVLGPSRSWSADNPTGTQQPAATQQPSATQQLSAAEGAPVSQLPPANWTRLTGTVQSVDKTAKTVQIRDDAGQVMQIPVDKQVKIEKDGASVKLSQIQAGDIILLAKKPSSPPSGSMSN